MRDETRKRLDRLIWLRRAKIIGGLLLACGVVAGGFALESLEATVDHKTVGGTITAVGPSSVPGNTGLADGLGVDVTLDDGRHAHVVALKAASPKVGEHVEIAEHIHGTGRHTFTWK
jgi:hypothetical protein